MAPVPVVQQPELVLKLMSGLHSVDGAPVDLSQTITYEEMMSECVPNLRSDL
jgi:hypothetical protein